jgi:membrane-bound ClpP family serine protease
MTITKPAAVAFQIIGGILLILGIMAIAKGAIARAVLAFALGGWMFW